MKIIWIGPVLDTTNESFTGRFYLHALIEQGYNIEIYDTSKYRLWAMPDIINKVKTEITANDDDHVIFQYNSLRPTDLQTIKETNPELFGNAKLTIIPFLSDDNIHPHFTAIKDVDVLVPNAMTAKAIIKSAKDNNHKISLNTINPPYKQNWLGSHKTIFNNMKKDKVFRIGTVIDHWTEQSGINEIIHAVSTEFVKSQNVELHLYPTFVSRRVEVEYLRKRIEDLLQNVWFRKDHNVKIELVSFSQMTYIDFINACDVLIQVPRFVGFDPHGFIGWCQGVRVIRPDANTIINNVLKQDSLWYQDVIPGTSKNTFICSTTVDQTISDYWKEEGSTLPRNNSYWYIATTWSIAKQLRTLYKLKVEDKLQNASLYKEAYNYISTETDNRIARLIEVIKQ